MLFEALCKIVQHGHSDAVSLREIIQLKSAEFFLSHHLPIYIPFRVVQLMRQHLH
jgi:hypothetical protein